MFIIAKVCKSMLCTGALRGERLHIVQIKIKMCTVFAPSVLIVTVCVRWGY
jgi:hypothetical protein